MSQETIVIETGIVFDTLGDDEKAALHVLKNRFANFCHGSRDRYLAIEFNIEQVSRIVHDKGEKVLWKRR